MTASASADRPGLLKSRVTHIWLAAAPLMIGLGLSDSIWPSERPLHESLEWAGYVALIVCVLGRSWCAAYIGGRKNDEMVTVGPYSVVRNPLYLFSFVGVAGIGLCTATATYLLLLLGLFFLYHAAAVRREEAHMTALFGDAYHRYAAEVPRWIPDFSLWRDIPDLVIKPHFLLRTMRESMWFFVALPMVELIEFGHEKGALPVLLHLP